MRTKSGHQQIASAFVEARKAGVILHSYPGNIPETMEEGYAIQDLAIALDGRPVGGWKVGRVPPQQVAKFDAERLVGPIFSDEIVDAADGVVPVMRVFGQGFAAAEAEILLRVASVPDGEISMDTIKSHIDDVRVGMEIASSPFPGINGFGAAVTVSDFGNNKGIVLGPTVPEWPSADLLSMPVSLQIEGKTVGEDQMSNMLDGPFGSVVFLLKELQRRGIEAAPGTWVSAGAITGVHEVADGQMVKARFGDSFEVALKVEAI